MKVCIAEKPSVAREIAAILGARTRHEGYFEGNGYQVTWTFGHLCTLKEPHDYNPRLKQWSIHSLPILPPKYKIKLITNQGVERQFNIIKSLFDKADEIINCGDAAQEGELIQRWVMLKAKCKKPVKRLWISSLTEEAIKEGFEHLHDSETFDRLYAAGSLRAIGDWLLGINGTRLYTLKYGSGSNVLSIGRVQTPTLALIVNRQTEIKNFKPEIFWELKTVYRDTTFSAISGKFTKKEDGENTLEEISEFPFAVTSVKIKKGKDLSPKLYDLTSLQVEANKKLNLTADETLRTVQELYEKKLVTYPRVDTVYLPDDMYPKIGGILSKMQDYKTFTEPLLKSKIKNTKRIFDNKKITDHHAIIPTGVIPGSIPGRSRGLYDLICKKFIAAFSPDSDVSNTTVLAEVVDTEFKATGKQILKPGWKAVYAKDKYTDDDDKKDTQLLPDFREGESGEHKPILTEKETNPPKYFTEATLLRAMETAGKQVDDEELRDIMKENGIGRPSTRANIIETLFRRAYLRKEGKRILATSTGLQLIGSIQNELLKSAELTGQWERKLRMIEQGKYEPVTFMKELNEMVSGIVSEVKNHRNVQVIKVEDPAQVKKAKAKQKPVVKKNPSGVKCPKCGNAQVIKGKTAYGCADWKKGCDFRLPFEYNSKKLTDKQINEILEKGKSSLIKGIEVDGKKVSGYLRFDKEFKLYVEEKIVETIFEIKCPKCRKGTIVKGKKAYGCTHWNTGCDFRLPFEVMSKTLTENQIIQLLNTGKSPFIKGFIHDFTKDKLNGKLIFDGDYKLVLEK